MTKQKASTKAKPKKAARAKPKHRARVFTAPELGLALELPSYWAQSNATADSKVSRIW